MAWNAENGRDAGPPNPHANPHASAHLSARASAHVGVAALWGLAALAVVGVMLALSMSAESAAPGVRPGAKAVSSFETTGALDHDAWAARWAAAGGWPEGAATPEPGPGARSSEIVAFGGSRGYDFYALETAPRVRVRALLTLPDQSCGAEPCAAVILSPGVGGLDASHAAWARLLHDAGYPTLVIDHFAPRGARGSLNALLVSEQQIMADVLAAARLLSADPRFSQAPIAHVGWGLGGAGGLAAASDRLSAYSGGRPEALRLAVSFYPWCAAEAEPRSEVRVRAFFAELDNVSPADGCARLFSAMAEAGTDARALTLEGAHHYFDRWALGQEGAAPIPIGVAAMRRDDAACRLTVDGEGRSWTLDGSQSARTPETRRAYLHQCGADDAVGRGAPEHRSRVEAALIGELDRLSRGR